MAKKIQLSDRTRVVVPFSDLLKLKLGGTSLAQTLSYLVAERVSTPGEDLTQKPRRTRFEGTNLVVEFFDSADEMIDRTTREKNELAK